MFDSLVITVAVETVATIAFYGALLGVPYIVVQRRERAAQKREDAKEHDYDLLQCAYECGRSEGEIRRDALAQASRKTRVLNDERMAA